MTTELQRAAIELQGQIFANEYYLDLYLQTLGRYNMSTASIDQSEFADKQLVQMLNSFWYALPDTKACRRAPFFQLCNLCESIFEE